MYSYYIVTDSKRYQVRQSTLLINTHILILLTAASPVIDSEITVEKLHIRPNGTPTVISSEPAAYLYDISRLEWTCVSSPWYLAGSPLRSWTNTGPLAEIELEVSEAWKGRPVEEAEKPEWWDTAMEMGHLETKMRAAELLDSKEEYRTWLIRYAGVLGKEGFRARAEELIKEFIGPVYQYVPLSHAGV